MASNTVDEPNSGRLNTALGLATLILLAVGVVFVFISDRDVVVGAVGVVSVLAGVVVFLVLVKRSFDRHPDW